MKLYCNLTPHTNINFKCIKGLNLRPEILKVLDENTHSDFMASWRYFRGSDTKGKGNACRKHTNGTTSD